MDSLGYYAVLGSVIAGAVGALVLTVAITHRLWWRGRARTALPTERARQQLIIRLADTFALLCFAGSAALAVGSVLQQARATTVPDAAGNRGEILARFEALETRLGRLEVERQAGVSAAQAAADDRIAHLERRVDAVEARATALMSRVPRARAANTNGPTSASPERVTAAPTSPSGTPRPTSTSAASEATPVARPSFHPALSNGAGRHEPGSAMVAPATTDTRPAAVAPPPPRPQAAVRDDAPPIADRLGRD